MVTLEFTASFEIETQEGAEAIEAELKNGRKKIKLLDDGKIVIESVENTGA